MKSRSTVVNNARVSLQDKHLATCLSRPVGSNLQLMNKKQFGKIVRVNVREFHTYIHEVKYTLVQYMEGILPHSHHIDSCNMLCGGLIRDVNGIANCANLQVR